ncbi:protein kinase domain-containing protein [Streptococcus zalophi]|uniref:protein kinase domain-containing protein n=1 Tax=Streptococcus zalophi TaxID=640031 RepID=UPI00215BE12B|nr:protein kinase [Streptococcus zalophi]MCR8968238.1 protein kinase [Streptococcus zalophi]
MVNPEFYESLAKIFCGDEEGLYEPKTGPQLVKFFNNYFNYQDSYGQGFDTRWRYVNKKLLDFSQTGKIDSFLSIILSKNYLLLERKTSEVEVLMHQKKICDELNKICLVYSLKITKKDNQFHLVEIDTDLVEIGKGGFAVIYLQKSTGLILKKLNEESIRKQSLRSRLKREFTITRSCSDIGSVIQVYDFDEATCSYTMEKAEATLESLIKESDLNENSKISIIRQILYTMKVVHEREVLHRDLSPSNIFMVNGVIKIADFGLGKNLKTLTSHQTMDTASFGQLFYCAPEQLSLLRDADKRSDVYSLGRIVNFIMTKDPINYTHFLRSICEKATNLEPDYRFKDANDMYVALNKLLDFRSDKHFEDLILSRISRGEFDVDIESYIYELPGNIICQKCITNEATFLNCLMTFMSIDDAHANYMIQLIDKNYKSVLKRYEDADPFGTLSYRVLKGNFSFTVNEVAAKILRYVAYFVGRFNAQDKIENIISSGVEPMIEEILEGK